MNNELYHYGVVGMKWGVRKDPSSTRSRSIGFNRDRYTNYEIRRAKRIARAGQHKGGLYTAARGVLGYATVKYADMGGRSLARVANVAASSLKMAGRGKEAAMAAVGGAAAWAGFMGMSLVSVERTIAAELYSRNKAYRAKIDNIASQKLYKKGD